MYNYSYDAETGGILLNTTPMQFSKEPRPVYYKELDLLGFDKYWKYEKQDNRPYMWAEANKYYYFGRLVAQLKGGNLYTAPEIEIKEELIEPLRAINITAMLESNADFLQVLEQETVKKIYDVWKRYKNKLDIFHVAFSGGKDSIVLLDLVKKALPKDEFVVVFGDTQMEFPDTYYVVDKVEAQCKAEGIRFFRAKSHMDVFDSWRAFAPPSRVLRWCCGVHKSTPQVLTLREYIKETLGKSDYSGLALVGVRGAESARRDEYDFESIGMKQRGQRSAYPILDWSSFEIWLYLYANKLEINKAYTQGSQRVGCLCCPLGGGKADYFQYMNYKENIDIFAQMIVDSNGRKHVDNNEYISNGGWNARKNGAFLKGIDTLYKERVENDYLVIEVSNPKTDWYEWIKTLGDIEKNEDIYNLQAIELTAQFRIIENSNGYIVKLPMRYTRESPVFGKHFRQVFRKAAYCVVCRTCEANCKNGCISFENDIAIKNCVKCKECHAIPVGCLAYHSLNIPQGDGKMKSINCFATHMPKTEWFDDFFARKNDFLVENNLGPVQKPFFKRFLKDAELIDGNEVSGLTDKLAEMSWNSVASLGIIMANMAYNPQFAWYIKCMVIGRFYTRADLISMLGEAGVTEKNAPYIINGFKRIVQTPFGMTLNFGYVDSEDNFIRNKCHIGSPFVILYSLYKFAEVCGDYYEFTVSRLRNFNIDSDGISPMQIFGIEEDELKKILQGLTASNPDFITAKFTHDLDTITLNRNKSASDVLALL